MGALIGQSSVIAPLLQTANTELEGTKGFNITGHMDKEESPSVHIVKPVCLKGNCAKGLSLSLPDLSIVDYFITISVLAFSWSWASKVRKPPLLNKQVKGYFLFIRNKAKGRRVLNCGCLSSSFFTRDQLQDYKVKWFAQR